MLFDGEMDQPMGGDDQSAAPAAPEAPAEAPAEGGDAPAETPAEGGDAA